MFSELLPLISRVHKSSRHVDATSGGSSYNFRRHLACSDCVTAYLDKQVFEVLELVLGVGLLDASSDLKGTIDEDSDLLEVLLNQATAAIHIPLSSSAIEFIHPDKHRDKQEF